jgi:hypothetical protein
METISMSWTKRVAFVLFALISSCASLPSALAAPVCPVRADKPLRFVEVFDGPVEDLATLVPDRAKARSGHWQLGYVYDAGRTVTIRCKYADDHMQDVKLEKRVARCEYKIDAKKTLSLSCK